MVKNIELRLCRGLAQAAVSQASRERFSLAISAVAHRPFVHPCLRRFSRLAFCIAAREAIHPGEETS
jgi:hypothetical protein